MLTRCSTAVPMNPTVEQIVMMETQIWEALRLGDADLDNQLLTTDFLGVYPSGFWNKQAHCEQLKNGSIIATYQLTEERLVHLTDGLVLLAYRAHYSWCRNPEKIEQMLITSIWKFIDGAWKNSFSQDTPVAG